MIAGGLINSFVRPIDVRTGERNVRYGRLLAAAATLVTAYAAKQGLDLALESTGSRPYDSGNFPGVSPNVGDRWYVPNVAAGR
jgi:hypothetical protein